MTTVSPFSSVKLSAELVEKARDAAQPMRRSVASQIEYWATLGRALENAGLPVTIIDRAAPLAPEHTWYKGDGTGAEALSAAGIHDAVGIVAATANDVNNLSTVVTAKQLTAGRRYAIVAVFVVAAVLTPPDPISQLMLAIPIVLLYEISIWCVKLIELRRKRDEQGTDVVPV